MKNKIRLDIIGLAEQIIKEDTAFDVGSMKNVVRSLYDKLAVLQYLESQLEDVSVVDKSQSLDSKSFREENWFTEPEPLPQSGHMEDLVEPLMEKIKDILAQMPEESQRVDDLLKEVLPQPKYIKNDLEEFASSYRETPMFERKEPSKGVDVLEDKAAESFPMDQKIKTHSVNIDSTSLRPKNLNDKLNQGLQIGLNDKLAFIKHLFDEKTEDYTRVLSQISTMKSYDEAANFISNKIKPDYNYWESKEEYSKRFMSIIENSFD
ncbi:MAG: hypothetical protein ACI9M9_002396 [Flavobacteriaceae bacterium]|jgi:hypothetical protein